jgi:hypothetical protein
MKRVADLHGRVERERVMAPHRGGRVERGVVNQTTGVSAWT